MSDQHRNETSPLAVAIVEALDPWPMHTEIAYGRVDALLEGVRADLRRLKAENNALRQRGPVYPRDALDL